MRDRLIFLVTFASALGSGVVAGVFFAFSTFVMRGLARIAPAQGIAAMNGISVCAVEPPLMILMFGTALGCLVLAVAALLARQRPDSMYLLIGAALYLAGVVIVTMIANVPLNDALAAADPASADGARLWSEYVVTWTSWNHVRTITALAAAVAFTIALLRSLAMGASPTR